MVPLKMPRLAKQICGLKPRGHKQLPVLLVVEMEQSSTHDQFLKAGKFTC